MRRRTPLLAAAILAGAAAWQLGGAGLIYAKAQLAQLLLHRAWAETRAGATDAKPWPWADTRPVARLRVPSRQIDMIVLAGASGRTLAFGPGHLDGTPLPGEAGNSVIGGHRDTSLAFLSDIATGEILTVETPSGRTVPYRVTGYEIVDSRQGWYPPEAGGRMLSLVTCYPFEAVVPGGPLRYVVYAAEVPPR